VLERVSISRSNVHRLAIHKLSKLGHDCGLSILCAPDMRYLAPFGEGSHLRNGAEHLRGLYALGVFSIRVNDHLNKGMDYKLSQLLGRTIFRRFIS
jgi:hypothetical protein